MSAIDQGATTKPTSATKRKGNWLASWRWDTDVDANWYYGGAYQRRLPGWQRFHVILGILYFAICVTPLCHFFGSKNPDAKATVKWMFVDWWGIGVLWLVTTSVGLPLFVWWENLRFEQWFNGVNSIPLLERKQVKERFDLNSKYMEATWKSVAGLYLVGGLLSFSYLSGADKETEVAALTNTVEALKIVVKDASTQPQRPEVQEAAQALSRAVDALSRLAEKPKSTPDGTKSSEGNGKAPSDKGDAKTPVGAPATTQAPGTAK